VITVGGTPFIHAYGTGNTFVGAYAGNFTTTGHWNTASGYQALYSSSAGNQNTASGTWALYSNTTGGNNSASGFEALYSNTTGYNNTASGSYALFFNTTGFQNTASGFQALSSNTTGYYNTASGHAALVVNTTGSNNTASGLEALEYNSDGSYNTAGGVQALHRSCYGVSSGCTANYNTALGYLAGVTGRVDNANITGANNTFIGAASGPGTSTQLNNATAIGYQALVSASNSLVLGGTGDYAVNVGVGTETPGEKLDVVGNINSSGNVTATSFSGSGSGLTNLSAANIGSGTANISITGNAATATTAAAATTATNAAGLGGVAAGNYARLDTGNSFSGNQNVDGQVSVTGSISSGGITLGGDTTMTKAPRMVVSAYIDLYNVSPFRIPNIVARLIPDEAIRVTRVTIAMLKAPSNCTAQPTIRVGDGATNIDITLPNAVSLVDSGPLEMDFADGANVDVGVQSLGADCDQGEEVNVLVQYKMR
jgi:hypothetical protein